MAIKFAPSIKTLREASDRLFTPAFYKDFQCIGAECENNCCHHWNVTMDKPTYQNFKNHGDIKIRQVAKEQTTSCGPNGFDYRQMKLQPNGDCPFLDEQRLCYVHKNHSEDILPLICKVYPRDNKLLGNEIYSSLSISCPEAARKILLDPSSMNIEQSAVTADSQMPFFASRGFTGDAPLLQRFKQLAYQCILAENADTIEERLFYLAVLFVMTSECAKQDMDAMLLRFERSLVTGELAKMYQETPVDQNAQVFVIQKLMYAQGFAAGNEVFLNYKIQAIDKIKLTDAYNETLNQLDLSDYYARFCQPGYQKLIDSHGFAFLNLLLHWIYAKPFELTDGPELFNQFSTFALKFFYVRLLCGILNDDDQQDPGALLVGVIHSISRKSDHDKYLSKQVYDSLIEQGLAKPEHILV
ncbi:MAG: YkgJ family cysteine cluster protein [Algicola sp.]|nr:YkgJ family cysteine cluster protein [Algicola sp.]